MRSVSLIEIDEFRECRVPSPLGENGGEFREMRELRRRNFGPPNKLREGSPVHPFCPERRKGSVEAENVIVCQALDFPGRQKRDRPFSLPLAGAGACLCCLGLRPDGFLTKAFLKMVCCSQVCRAVEELGVDIVPESFSPFDAID